MNYFIFSERNIFKKRQFCVEYRVIRNFINPFLQFFFNYRQEIHLIQEQFQRNHKMDHKNLFFHFTESISKYYLQIIKNDNNKFFLLRKK